MKKLSISQPTRGKTDEEILRVRNEAICKAKDTIKDDDVEVLDNFLRGAPADGITLPLWFLGESLNY